MYVIAALPEKESRYSVSVLTKTGAVRGGFTCESMYSSGTAGVNARTGKSVCCIRGQGRQCEGQYGLEAKEEEAKKLHHGVGCG